MVNKIDDFYEHKYGIEVEMTGISREEAAKVLAEFFNVHYEKLEDVPKDTEKFDDQFKIKDEKNRIWKIVADTSILATNNQQVEFVTPVLTYKDIDVLKQIIGKFKRSGAKVNKTCGLHIHLDASIHNIDSICSFIEFIGSNQNELKKIHKVHKERKMHCYNLDYSSLSKLKIFRPKSYKQIKHMFNKKSNIINLLNISEDKNTKKNTIELRYLNSTLDKHLIEKHIVSAIGLSIYCINRKNLIEICLNNFTTSNKEDYKYYPSQLFTKLEIPEVIINKLMKHKKTKGKFNNKTKEFSLV